MITHETVRSLSRPSYLKMAGAIFRLLATVGVGHGMRDRRPEIDNSLLRVFTCP